MPVRDVQAVRICSLKTYRQAMTLVVWGVCARLLKRPERPSGPESLQLAMNAAAKRLEVQSLVGVC